MPPRLLANMPPSDRPSPSDSARMLRDLGVGCGVLLAGIAAVILAIGFLAS